MIVCQSKVHFRKERKPYGRVDRFIISLNAEIQLTRNMRPCTVTNMKIEDAASRLEALGSPTRLRIYRALIRAGHAGMPVGRLADKLKVAGSTMTYHLKALMAVGLIRQERDGVTLVCHANYEAMRGLVDFLGAECCADETETNTKTAA